MEQIVETNVNEPDIRKISQHGIVGSVIHCPTVIAFFPIVARLLMTP
jgi:hypothetical protein